MEILWHGSTERASASNSASYIAACLAMEVLASDSSLERWMEGMEQTVQSRNTCTGDGQRRRNARRRRLDLGRLTVYRLLPRAHREILQYTAAGSQSPLGLLLQVESANSSR